MGKRKEPLVPQAEENLAKLKEEVAKELGLADDIKQRGWGEMTTRETGKIGGNMVRKMIRFTEKSLSRPRGVKR